ncbi:MAG: parvulin-like peptidyl-prolyl isomerase [Myxococcota bacterium]
MPEVERAELRAKLAEMKALSKDEKRELLEKAERWSQMPAAKREKLREQMERLRAMPADERSELLEKALGKDALGN